MFIVLTSSVDDTATIINSENIIDVSEACDEEGSQSMVSLKHAGTYGRTLFVCESVRNILGLLNPELYSDLFAEEEGGSDE